MEEVRPEVIALTLPARTVLVRLLAFAIVLTLLSGIGRLLRWYAWPPQTYGAWLARMFDVNLEHNVPSFYSSLLILLCVPLLLYAFQRYRIEARDYAWHWAALALIFLIMSFDEAVELHGQLNDPVARTLGASNYITYGWTVPAAAALVLIGTAFGRFLLSLPRATALTFLASGAIYVLGALGLELVAGFVVSEHFTASENQKYVVATLSEHLEELAEMSGISLFLYGILRHVGEQFGGIALSLRTG